MPAAHPTVATISRPTGRVRFHRPDLSPVDTRWALDENRSIAYYFCSRRFWRSTVSMVRANAFVLVVFSIFQSALSYAADWPLYRGPNQDGISQEKIVVQWTGNSPNVVWRTPTNRGFSSFAISNGKVFTQVVRRLSASLPGPGCGNWQGTLGRRYLPRQIGRRWRHGRRRRWSAVYAHRERRQGLSPLARSGRLLPRRQHRQADLEM